MNSLNKTNSLYVTGKPFLLTQLENSFLQVDKLLFIQYEEVVNYWQSILTIIISVVKVLSVRGFLFQRDNENYHSSSNGLYMEYPELISINITYFLPSILQ